jgi:hypothetical protein
VLGSLWNGKDKPPESNANGKNNVRSITSRSGHQLRLDDTAGAEKLEIVVKGGKSRIVFDAKAGSVTVTSGGDLVVEAPSGKLTLHGKEVELTSDGKLAISATGAAELSAKSKLTLRGQQVDIN